MEAKQINERAMDLLKKGEFNEAQELFYRNMRENSCYQTYNNLGLFLYENGLTLRNGKEISACKLGKRYLLKALELRRDAIVFRNLGRISYEERDFNSAYNYFSLSYAIEPNDCVLYNLALSLFGLRRFSDVCSCLEIIKQPPTEALTLRLFSMALADSENFISIGNFPKYIDQMDLLDRMLLLYIYGQYHKIVEMEELLNKQWSLNENEWAILIDSFVKADELEKLSQMIEKKLRCSETSCDKRVNKSIRLFFHNEKKRKNSVDNYFSTITFPQISLCGYYGCNSHQILW